MLESTKVPALTRAIEILNLISRIGPCSAATIIAELGIPKSTVYLLLGELKKQRFISMDNQDNYCLWTKLVELAGQGMTMLCVTHEMGFAQQVADRVVFMDGGQILEVQPPEQFFHNPQSERSRAFLGKILRHAA